MIKVFIDGQAGTTGLQLRNKLLQHPFVELLEIENDKRKDADERSRLMNSADVVFLCLPDSAAIEAVKLVSNPETIIIDASTAHRTNDEWTYGFSELSQEHYNAISKSKRIANPGCHATGFISIIYPLISGGIMGENYPVTAHSITGYSGGGNKMIAEYEDENRAYEYNSPRQYGLTQMHKHLPEMVKITGLLSEPVFNPIVADFHSGMAVSVPIFSDMLKVKMSLYDMKRYFARYYENSKFITVHSGPESGFLSATGLEGTNNLRIYICGNDDRMTITAVFDNLGKGASSAAIQNMNIAMGFDESTAL